MRILQIVLPGATEFEKKCQRIDFAALSPKHEVLVAASTRDAPQVDLAHIYGPVPLPSAPLIGFMTPYVASSAPARSRFGFRRPSQPAVIIWSAAAMPPLSREQSGGIAAALQKLTEAVEAIYFAAHANSRE